MLIHISLALTTFVVLPRESNSLARDSDLFPFSQDLDSERPILGDWQLLIKPTNLEEQFFFNQDVYTAGTWISQYKNINCRCFRRKVFLFMGLTILPAHDCSVYTAHRL